MVRTTVLGYWLFVSWVLYIFVVTFWIGVAKMTPKISHLSRTPRPR